MHVQSFKQLFVDFAMLVILQCLCYGYNIVNANNRCALKFFGYTNHKPVLKDIHQEIRLMISLDQVDGVCQLLGIFEDTPQGYMPEKFAAFSEPYPVIVMEMLEGGDLFARISNRRDVTENYLAVTFMSMMRALQSLHGRNFLHRDLKLGMRYFLYRFVVFHSLIHPHNYSSDFNMYVNNETNVIRACAYLLTFITDNVMLISNDDDSSVKLIDFGMMVGLDYPNESMKGTGVVGTEGYFAPESLTKVRNRPFCYCFRMLII